MTIISDFAGSPDPSYLLENIVAIIKMGVYVFLRGLLVNGEMVGYTILYSSLMM